VIYTWHRDCFVSDMKKAILVIAMVILTGCASHARYKKAVYGWINEDIDHLVQKWGYPDGTFERSDGFKVYIYSKGGSHYVPGRTTAAVDSIMGNDFVTVTQLPGYSVTLSCKTYFVVDEEGTIAGVEFEGNHCVK
jgi:hypothetical protein